MCVFISTENVAGRKISILASVLNDTSFLYSVPVFWKGLNEGVMRMQVGMEKIQQSIWMKDRPAPHLTLLWALRQLKCFTCLQLTLHGILSHATYVMMCQITETEIMIIWRKIKKQHFHNFTLRSTSISITENQFYSCLFVVAASAWRISVVDITMYFCIGIKG